MTIYKYGTINDNNNETSVHPCEYPFLFMGVVWRRMSIKKIHLSDKIITKPSPYSIKKIHLSDKIITKPSKKSR